jgi:hypothetical protein
MPKRNYGFEKRQKELKRQEKREEKRQRKLEKAEQPADQTHAYPGTPADKPSE